MKDKHPTDSIFLYDIAGAIIATFCLAPFVSVVWNAVVLTAFLTLSKNIRSIGLGRLLLGLAIISIGGALIDWFAYIAPTSGYINSITQAYYNNFRTNPVGTLVPRMDYPPFLGLYFMPLAILCLGLFNFFLGMWFFRFNRRKSTMLGITMGFLTAPWLVYLYSYAHY